MATAIQVAGVCEVQVGTSGGSLQILGKTANGAEVTKEAFHLNVPGDDNGGDDGPPIDIQILGEIARVRLELTKWDVAVSVLVEARAPSGTAGQPTNAAVAAGTLMFTDGETFRLLLNTADTPINFPRAIPRGTIEINRGTKFSRLIIEFECHKDSTGVLYNNSVAGAV